ncbi:hypothetical protein [Thalassotalea euphylliae]|uniref:STAS domain-containing protein n=1 Tax=Thalassotalea euphylliae TaxID=1655234 RepID=A0A3E0UHN7_9GAMM|nr:hypothetical protein [Thalassotalea euphylliae]REL36376.1 hypothetical protein DXX92_14225 [Thalassotalea euphylliae]
MPLFSAHGKFEVRVKGNCLYTLLQGTWNKEATDNYTDEVKRLAKAVTDSAWVRVVDLEKFEGGSAEVTEGLTNLQRWAKKNGCIYVVFILPKSLVQYMLQSAHEAYLPFDIVQSQQEAELLAQRKLEEYKFN